MEDYKSLYYLLFNGITDEIERLKQLQCAAEELFEQMEGQKEKREKRDCTEK